MMLNYELIKFLTHHQISNKANPIVSSIAQHIALFVYSNKTKN